MTNVLKLATKGVLLCGIVALAVSCFKDSTTTNSTYTQTPMTRQQAENLNPEVWGPLANGMEGIRVDGTNEQGQQLYYFIGADGDSLGFGTDPQAVAQVAEWYWMPR